MNRALLVLVLSACQGVTAEAPDAGPEVLRIESPEQLRAIVGVPLTVALVARGGTLPYLWALAPGSSLPAGLALSAGGELQGAPTEAGSFSFGLNVADAEGRMAASLMEVLVQEVGDTCADATSLLFLGEQAFVEGTLAGYLPDGLTVGCALPDGPDRFYRLEIEETSQVTLELKGEGFTAALYEPGCSQAPAVCAPKLLRTLAKGTYVFGVTGPSARFELTVKVHRVFPQGPGDTCEDAIPLQFSGGEAHVSGTFGGAARDLQGCGVGPDRIYAFTLSQAADVEVSGSAAFSIRSGASCATSTQLACVPGKLRVPNLPPGSYFLVLSSVTVQSTESYAATVKVLPPSLPPANTSCSTAVPVTFVDDLATLTGDLRWGGPVTKSCEGPAVFHAIDLDQRSHLHFRTMDTVSLQVLGDGCSWITGACKVRGNDLCEIGLDPGRYYLRVQWSDPGSTPGPFQVQISRRATVAANATCESAAPLALEAGKATVSGEVRGGSTGFKLPCDGPGLWAVFYRLRLERRSALKVTLANSGEHDWFALAVWSGSCAAGTYGGCQAAKGTSSSLSVAELEPGDHWIVVKGTSLAWDSCWVGRFDLTVEATPG